MTCCVEWPLVEKKRALRRTKSMVHVHGLEQRQIGLNVHKKDSDVDKQIMAKWTSTKVGVIQRQEEE